MKKRDDENQSLLEEIMKRAKQILWLVPFHLLSLSVLPASAQSITLSASTGHTGDVVTITGTHFSPHTSGLVFFDQDYNYFLIVSEFNNCGKFNNTPCEPYVPVTTDAIGNFVTTVRIPPGKRVDFLGADNYLIGFVPVGGLWAGAPFKVSTDSFNVKGFTWQGAKYVSVSGSGFVPYEVNSGAQSHGIVWMDVNNDGYWKEGEPFAKVWVTPDGYLSACPDSLCGVTFADTTGKSGVVGLYVRAWIYHENGNANPIPEQASAFLAGCAVPGIPGCLSGK